MNNLLNKGNFQKLNTNIRIEPKNSIGNLQILMKMFILFILDGFIEFLPLRGTTNLTNILLFSKNIRLPCRHKILKLEKKIKSQLSQLYMAVFQIYVHI